MESNMPVIAKKFWSIVRIAYFMLRKSISKGKLMMDFNVMLKRRSKIAGKAISNLMFHHNHHGGSASSRFSSDKNLQFSGPREYEFSCSNTPNHFFPISKRHRHSHSHSHSHFFTCAHAPATQDDDVVTDNVLKAALELININEAMVEASPALPGFGRSPMVRQLRVTDSPFPLREAEEDKDHLVDKAAEEFIKRFYKELKKQN